MTSHSAVLLKDIRRRLDLTQRALAQSLGVTARTVSRWEAGVTEMPATAVPRALLLLRARDPGAADQLGIDAGVPGAVAQENARRAALDHAVFAVADALDASPRRVREVLATFLTHIVASGLGASDARARLVDKVKADAATPPRAVDP